MTSVESKLHAATDRGYGARCGEGRRSRRAHQPDDRRGGGAYARSGAGADHRLQLGPLDLAVAAAVELADDALDPRTAGEAIADAGVRQEPGQAGLVDRAVTVGIVGLERLLVVAAVAAVDERLDLGLELALVVVLGVRQLGRGARRRGAALPGRGRGLGVDLARTGGCPRPRQLLGLGSRELRLVAKGPFHP